VLYRYIAVFALGITLLGPCKTQVVQAQTTLPPTATTPALSAPTVTVAQPPPGPTNAELAIKIDQLGKDAADLRDKFAWFTTFFVWILVGFGVLLALLGGIPVVFAIVGGISANQRAKETHEIYAKGERSAQGRADDVHRTFLASSKDTLDLVNATLTLAKEASERAASIIQRRAETLWKDLDYEAKSLLTEASTKDDRYLVSDPDKRSDLTSLANRINNFEINSFSFPVELPLSPDCQFIRGMEFHIKQQFKDAFRAWEIVALNDKAPEDRRSLAWYWIGYERNNLGEFDKAEESFRNAERLATGPRKFELQRIRLETRFFNKKLGLASLSLPELQALLNAVNSVKDVNDEILLRRRKVMTTLANVSLQAGQESDDRKEQERLYRQAETMFREVMKAAELAQADEKWAIFGLGQTLYLLGETSEAERILAGPAREAAQNEYINRVEPRTKVLARATELICCALVPDISEEGRAVHGDLIDALGNVDSRLTVYSQFRKRNVKKDEFKADLAEFLKEHPISEDRRQPKVSAAA
jgi:tetratricopeptide (TPR) repeat protein